MNDYVSNNVSPRFAVYFEEKQIKILHEHGEDVFKKDQLKVIKINKPNSTDTLSMIANIISIITLEFFDIGKKIRKKDAKLIISKRLSKDKEYSLRYLEDEKIDQLTKLLTKHGF